MKRILAFVICLWSAIAAAQTPIVSRDYSDMWWNASESGWGMNVVHQDSILFVTFFIYGADRKPTWYVGSAINYVSTNAAGDETFRGDLYASTGSPFAGVPFDSNSVVPALVGTMTFVGLANGGASISYSVNGANVSKTITRFTFRSTAIAGATYSGATSYTRSGCASGSQADPATYTLTITANTFKLVEVNGPGKICNWNGNYTQNGRFGQSTGTVVCEDNVVGNYQMTAIQVSPQAFSSAWTAQATPSCGAVSSRGRISGTKTF